MIRHATFVFAGLALAAAAQAQQFKLASGDIKPNGTIADEQVFNGFGCTGKNVSPALKWSGAPKGTKSFALLVHDPDAPTGGAGWWHWVVINIPASATELPKGAGTADGAAMPAGTAQINTDFGGPGLGRTLPAARRQAASLHLHGVRAQDRQARCSRRRHRGADRFHDPWECTGQGELHRKIRARQIEV
jgi:Raf kinase inhibitor-like YbhB/YbcL family protein